MFRRKPDVCVTLPFLLGQSLSVRIEVPRGGRVKRAPSGRVEFISPIACPYNYGSVQDCASAPDGEDFDALVLGPRVSQGQVAGGRLLGVVDFVDRGVADPKLVVGVVMSEGERAAIDRFFRRYARIKGLLRMTLQTQHRGWLALGEM